MNPNLCHVALRPRTPLEVFDLTLCLLRERAQGYLRLTAVVITVPALVLGVAAWATSGHWGVLGAALLCGPVLQAPFTLMTGRALFDVEVGVGEVLSGCYARLGPLVVAWLYEALAALVGLAMCAVGWLITSAPTTYLAEAALLERVPPGRGLQRSVRLAGAHPAVALMAAASRVALTVWCLVVFEAAGQALMGTVLQLGSPFGSLWDGTVTPFAVLGVLVGQPLHAVYRLLLYVDVRTRVEGWDLQVGLRAAGLGAT